MTHILPRAVEAERSLLGGVLLYNEAFPQLLALSADDFSLDSHRRIFLAVVSLARANSPMDIVTLTEELIRTEELQIVGGTSYISALTDGIPKLANLEHYVKLVKEKSELRQLIHLNSEISEEAMADPANVKKFLKQARKKLAAKDGNNSKPSAASNGDLKAPLQPPFWTADDGVHATLYNDQGEARGDMWICGKLDVEATTCDENGDSWGRLLVWRDRDERKHSWAMPMQMLAGGGDTFRQALLNGGLEVATSKAGREKLTEYVSKADPEEQAMSVTKVGWHGDVFVLPEETIGPTEKRVFYQPPQEMAHFIREQGSLEDWRNYIGKFCSGNSRLILAVSVAFAAPLIALTDSEGGGFHFYGDSTTGKSTALMVAGSVWGGGGRDGYIESWRATANGLEACGEIHNDGLACLDEMGQMDAREISSAVYMLVNGSGKGRMTKSIGSRKRLMWKLLFLSSGELTLTDHVESIGRTVKMGVEIRLVNISANAGARLEGKPLGIFENLHGFVDNNALKPAKPFAEHLTKMARHHYGAPIRKFLKYLTANQEKVSQEGRKRIDIFQRDAVPMDAPGEVRRAARRFALAVYAGELATELGITGWDHGEISPLIQRCLKEWHDSRQPSESQNALQTVRRFIELHGASRFQNADPQCNLKGDLPVERIINRAGFVRLEKDGESTQFMFLPEVFKSEVCRGFDMQSVLLVLKEKGFLIPGDGNNNARKVRIPNLGNQRLYCISSEILG